MSPILDFVLSNRNLLKESRSGPHWMERRLYEHTPRLMATRLLHSLARGTSAGALSSGRRGALSSSSNFPITAAQACTAAGATSRPLDGRRNMSSRILYRSTRGGQARATLWRHPHATTRRIAAGCAFRDL
eukprot:1550885-Pleurochrysis_carterae.AAC.3